MQIVETGIAIIMEDLNIWQEITGTGEQEIELGKGKDWNTEITDKD